MVDKSDIIFITTACTIIGGVYSLIATGFLDPLNRYTVYTYFPPQLIMIFTFAGLMAWILGGFAANLFTGKETRELMKGTADQFQNIANNYGKSLSEYKKSSKNWPAPQKILLAGSDIMAKDLPRPDALALSLKIKRVAAYGVNAVLAAVDAASLGAPLEGGKRESPSLKYLIPLTNFERKIWGRAALILIVVFLGLIYLVLTGNGVV